MARKTNRFLEVTEEEISKINPDNLELINDFLNYLETTDKSSATITVYKSNLYLFFVYLMNYVKNKDFVNIKKRDIMNWQNYLIKGELSPARIRNLRASVSSLSNFIENILDEEEKWEGFRNIVNKIPAPNARTIREKTVLEDEQCEKLLDYLVNNKMYQQACAFALAYASGRRKSELLRIKRSYITDDNLIYGSLYKTPEKIKTKGRGVGGKMLYVYILKNKFKKYFDLWEDERKRLGVPNEIDEMFVVKKGNGEWQSATISVLDYYTKMFSELLGVDFYFHSLRHNFTTSLSASNIPTNVIKDLQGWSSIEMVNLYTDSEVDDEIGKYFSEEGIKQVETKGLNDL